MKYALRSSDVNSIGCANPELVEPFTVALNTDDAIPELWFDVLLPQLARLDNMTVGVDYTGHRA